MMLVLQSFSFGGPVGFYGLGMLQLQAVLQAQPDLRDGTEVECVHSDYFDPLDAVVAEIAGREPDILGLSVFVWSRDLTAQLLERCAALPHRPVIVCGGTGLHGCEHEFLADNPSIDVVVRGEGEVALVELVRALGGLSAQRGMRPTSRESLESTSGMLAACSTVRPTPRAPCVWPACPLPTCAGTSGRPG